MRKTLKELFAPDGPAEVSSVVDPSEPFTDPGHPEYYPQNQNELSQALGKLCKELPDDFVRPFYQQVTQTLTNFRKNEKLGSEGNMTKKQMEQKKIEEALRKVVRSMLVEMNVVEAPEDEELGAVPPAPKKKLGGVNPDRMHNQGKQPDGPKFNEIGDEFGWGASHAKGMVTRAIDKAQWLQRFKERAPDDFEEWVTDAAYDYIDQLKGLGTLPGDAPADDITPEDIKFLADHPEAVIELDSFRQFFAKYIKAKGYNDPYSKAAKKV